MTKNNTPDQAAFFRTLAAGDRDQIQAIVSAEPQILECFDYGQFGATPLTWACFSNRTDLVELLIELGADPNRRSDWHMGPWSPLHCAIFRRDKDLAMLLISKGAVQDVHTAAGLGDCDTILNLLDSDPTRVNERGGDGCQPLHFADTVDVARLLLERGAEINGRCIDHHSTPVQYLCTTRPKVAQFLLATGATSDIVSSAACGDTGSIEKLLRENPDLINVRVNQTFFPPVTEQNVHNTMTFSLGLDATALHAAAKGDSSAAVSLLVDHGLSPNVRGGYDHATPLHLAAWSNCNESALALVNHGADIEARSGKLHNNTPAGWSIVAGADTVFELLMDRGAQYYPWFLDDARDACAGRFDQISRASKDQRLRILSRLETDRSKTRGNYSGM
ncbi:MAG: ankyrin repeat domain-containing protein [Planctomycetales bacterium]|nr:ankyrin repeat domain-containing protein [Planctomycetales bacterium]